MLISLWLPSAKKQVTVKSAGLSSDKFQVSPLRRVLYMTSEDARHKSFPLRLPPSLRLQSNELARLEGISLNHFISLAIAEKISRMQVSEDAARITEKTRPSLSLVSRKPLGTSNGTS